MALFKRCRMGKEVYLQRIWRWERSLHPDAAKCGDSSMTHTGLLFGLSWFWPHIEATTEGTNQRSLLGSSSCCACKVKAGHHFVNRFFFLHPIFENIFQLDFCSTQLPATSFKTGFVLVSPADLVWKVGTVPSAAILCFFHPPSAWIRPLGTITEVISSCCAQSSACSPLCASALGLLAIHPLPF